MLYRVLCLEFDGVPRGIHVDMSEEDAAPHVALGRLERVPFELDDLTEHGGDEPFEHEDEDNAG